jgi:DNA-binding transcriptional ArsR family regulator
MSYTKLREALLILARNHVGDFLPQQHRIARVIGTRQSAVSLQLARLRAEGKIRTRICGDGTVASGRLFVEWVA